MLYSKLLCSSVLIITVAGAGLVGAGARGLEKPASLGEELLDRVNAIVRQCGNDESFIVSHGIVGKLESLL